MSLGLNALSQVGNVWRSLGRSIRKHEDHFTKVTLALFLANLTIYTVASEVSYKKQTEAMQLYIDDLAMIKTTVGSDEWISAFDEKLKGSADRPKIIKSELMALVQKCVTAEPIREVRPERPVIVRDLEEDDIAEDQKPFPDDGGRIM